MKSRSFATSFASRLGAGALLLAPVILLPACAKKTETAASSSAASTSPAVSKADAALAAAVAAGKMMLVPLNDGGRIELVRVEPGTFTMGVPDDAKGRMQDQGPLTGVTLTSSFWLGRTEVTQAQWTAVMGQNPSRFTEGGAVLPVDHVSWDDAVAFCARLTEQERAAGRIAASQAFTLPTEAQWEFAARAGQAAPHGGAANIDDVAWYSGNSRGKTFPVAQKKPNPWGFFDLYGNIGEWCRDFYKPALPGGEVVDPTGSPTGTVRVYRGGHWGLSPALCDAPARHKNRPDYRGFDVGLRVALTAAKP